MLIERRVPTVVKDKAVLCLRRRHRRQLTFGGKINFCAYSPFSLANSKFLMYEIDPLINIWVKDPTHQELGVDQRSNRYWSVSFSISIAAL